MTLVSNENGMTSSVSTLNENARAWVAALRSRHYSQNRGALKVTGGSGRADGYCCLGVACEISGLGRWLDEGIKQAYRVRMSNGEYASSVDVLPTPVADWLGIATLEGSPMAGALMNADGSYDVPTWASLAQANDAGVSFADIADLIEMNARELFRVNLVDLDSAVGE